MKKFIALVALLCTVMISSTAAAANWVWIRSDDKFTHYVDNNSIRRDYNYSGYVFRAFVKIIYNEAGRNWQIEDWRTKFGEPLPRGIYSLSHEVALMYFKAADGMKYFDFVTGVFYTRDGNTIPEMGGSKNSPQWKIVTPDSIAEALFDAIYARVPN